MVFDKQLKAILFLIKKIQIHFQTWKNGIEISFAYQSQSKKKGNFSAVVRKGAILFSIVSLCGAAVFFLVKYQMPIRAGISKLSVLKILKILPLDKASAPPEVAIPADTVSTVEHNDTIQFLSTEIESTLMIPPPPPVVKPVVKKVGMQLKKDTSEYYIVVANKAAKSMYLLQLQLNKWCVVKEYDIAIGEQDGKKLYAGDRRTPEGLYFVVGRKERSELSKIYGPLSYVLNYPNEEDRKAGRTGQGIWIHGTDPDSLPLETKGCLEMNNKDLEELSRILKKGIGTPVLIVNNEVLSDPTLALDYPRYENERKTVIEEYQNALLFFEKYIEGWKRAWETKNIVEYSTFYDTLQFKGQGLDWNSWRERKLRTFSLYDTISIAIDNVLITDYSDHATIVKFNQRYTTNINSNEIAKKLSLVKIDDSWKISSESTCLKEELLL